MRHVAKADVREPCVELREDGERVGAFDVRRKNGGVEGERMTTT